MSGIWCQKVKDLFLLMEIQIKSEADPENSERGGPRPPPSLPPTNENFTFQDMQQ